MRIRNTGCNEIEVTLTDFSVFRQHGQPFHRGGRLHQPQLPWCGHLQQQPPDRLTHCHRPPGQGQVKAHIRIRIGYRTLPGPLVTTSTDWAPGPEKLVLIIKHIFTILKILSNILKVTEDFGTDPHPDPSVRGTGPRIRICIRNPYQKVTDPEHWFYGYRMLFSIPCY